MRKSIWRSNLLLYMTIAVGIACIGTQLYLAAEGDAMLMAVLLLSVTLGFILLIGMLKGIGFLAIKLSEKWVKD